jgi:hypothetical protein
MEQTTAYIRLIDQAGSNAELLSIKNLLVKKQEDFNEINRKQEEAKANEKKETNNSNLESILAMQPSHEVAVMLFEKNEAAFNSIFQEPTKRAYDKEAKNQPALTLAQQNFQELMTRYLAGSDEGAKNVTLTKISIKQKEINDNYMK